MDNLMPSPLWAIFAVILVIVVEMLKKEKLQDKIRFIMFTAFFYYIFRVLTLTLFPFPITELAKESIRHRSYEIFINLKPLFMGFQWQALKTHILNIIMFIPYGLLLPMSVKKQFNLKMIIRNSFMFSLLIETLQLLISLIWIHAPYRIFDINDLFLNTLGGLIGWGIYLIARNMIEYINIRFAQKAKIN